MSFFFFDNIAISGISAAVPKIIRRTEDLYAVYGKDTIEKFLKATGIKEVHVSAKNQTASDLGFVAAKKLLKQKNVSRDDIGLLIFGAHSFDYRRPATACVLHKRLKLTEKCAAFDVNLGCSAFVYSIQIAASMMQNSNIQKALVITGETVSKLANPRDRSVALMFGDAGCAILLEKKKAKMSGSLYTDGNGFKAIIAPAGGFRNLDASKTEFIFSDGIIRNLYNIWMNGTDVFAFSITTVPKAIDIYMKKVGTNVDSYDYFILHQANYLIQNHILKKLNIPDLKAPISFDRYGNTSAASIPLTLCDAFGHETENRHISFLSCGFGVGLSWGVLATEISTADVFPIVETDGYFKEGLIRKPEDWGNE